MCSSVIEIPYHILHATGELLLGTRNTPSPSWGGVDSAGPRTQTAPPPPPKGASGQ